jgi:uncharacterized phiE125 gp8 family phage protein
MGLKLIIPPATGPVTLAEAKQHLNVNVADFDALITRYIGSATTEVENWLGRALVDQTWELSLDTFPPNEMRIPKPPLIQIVSINYDNEIGDEITLAPSAYTVDLEKVDGYGWILPDGTWPATFDGINSVRVRYRAGYLNHASPPAMAVPDDIRHAVLLGVEDAFDTRGTISIGLTVFTSKAWTNLLETHRVRLGMA